MKIIVDELINNERLDLYLSKILTEFSRSRLQQEIKNGKITVDEVKIKPSAKLKGGEVIVIDDDLNQKSLQIIPEKLPLEIVWENENMAVINKPSGMLTHPTTSELSGTLVNALLYHYGRENLSDINGEMRLGIVHRLDRNTSGLIMIAKNNKTHEFLTNKMKEKAFRKNYLAVVRGVIEQDEFMIKTPIGRHPTQPYKMAVSENGKESLSIIKVLKRFKSATLIDVTLVTGRTHQIRVHLSSINHPVYNDTLYGFGKMKIRTEEQVLQSYKLEFPEPFSENKILLEIPMDAKLQKVLNFLEQE
ncbi:MAG: RluA family pseudouridine synthase [bacterium]|nr:RluA family pseudouridine synthase [bacterium]